MGSERDPQHVEMELCTSNLNNLYQPKLPLHEQIIRAANNGATKFNLFFKAASGSLPVTFPKQLKQNLTLKIKNVNLIEHIQFTRQNHLLIVTENLETAIEVSKIKAILGIPTICSVIYDQITSRFLLRRVPTDISLKELCDELEEENGIHIHEARRFSSRISQQKMSENVLITMYGTILPQYIKLWLIRQEISMFFDQPRQCKKCYLFTHPTAKCKYDFLCYKCGEHHNPETCTSTEMKCGLCKGLHVATDPKCPKREQEKKFLKYKCVNHLSFVDARRKFQPEKKSYASVSSTPTNKSEETQYVSKLEFTEILHQQMAEQRNMLLEIMNSQVTALQQAMEKLNEHLTTNLTYITQALQNITQVVLNKDSEDLESARPPKIRKSQTEPPNIGTIKQSGKTFPSSQVLPIIPPQNISSTSSSLANKPPDAHFVH